MTTNVTRSSATDLPAKRRRTDLDHADDPPPPPSSSDPFTCSPSTARSPSAPFSEQRVECGHTPANGCPWALRLQATGQYVPCGSQQRKLMVRHEWATTLHIACDGKHAGLSRDARHNQRTLRSKRRLMLSIKAKADKYALTATNPSPGEDDGGSALPLRSSLQPSTPPVLSSTNADHEPTASVRTVSRCPLDVLLSALVDPADSLTTPPSLSLHFSPPSTVPLDSAWSDTGSPTHSQLKRTHLSALSSNTQLSSPQPAARTSNSNKRKAGRRKNGEQS